MAAPGLLNKSERRARLRFRGGVFLVVVFRFDAFLAAAALRGDFFPAAFFLLVARFLLAARFLPATFLLGVFLAEVFFFPAFADGRFLLLVRRAVFFLLVFLADVRRADRDFAAFFPADFFFEVFFTEVFLPLALLLAAAFLLGIEIASKVNSENRRLYIRNGRAEAF